MASTPSILSKILQWSTDIPLWQRDALRRIVTSDSLTEADISALVEFCKKNAQNNNFPEATPLSSAHVPQQGVADQAVSLESMKNLKGVNRLPSDQTLTFSSSPGITLIYGDNGTGKSSYARVLKSACRSRGSSSPILSDIYSPKPTEPASAEINFRANTAADTYRWIDQQETEPLLTNVFVFDTHAALHYVQQSDKTAFTPFGLDILKQLAVVADRVAAELRTSKISIQSEKADLKNKWKFTANTSVSRLVEALNHDTKETAITALMTLSDKETKRHENLKETLKSDPVKKARETRARSGRIKAFSEAFKTITKNLSKENIIAIQAKLTELSSKQTELKDFKEQFFASGYITGTGGSAWLKLWNAAKDFSESDAYIDIDFPNVEGKCVLCQQDLGIDSRKRFKSFKEYIENELQADIKKLKEDLSESRSIIEKTTKVVPLFGLARVDLEAEALDDLSSIESIAEKADSAITEALRILVDSKGSLKEFSSNEIPDKLDAIVNALNDRAETEESANDPEKRKLLQNEFNDLNDRVTLAGEKASVLQFIAFSKKEQLLEDAIKLTRTNAITKKNGELIKAAVTKPFCQRFSEEVSGLGLESIQVEMVEYPGRKGDLTFGIELQKSESGRPADIASEGEQRCLAIAAFFAELAQANHHSALVFDDPVSSLDISYREAIAERLVEEAKVRQVVVFTHDSFFLNELLVLSENDGVTSLPCYVEWANSRPGAIRDGVPWACQKPHDRIVELDAVNARLKSNWNPVPSEANKSDIAKAYSKLRSTLERIVEAIVFNGAIERFNPYIDLKRLRSRVDLEEKDEEELHRIFKRCCNVTDAHDKPRAAQGVTAKPADFEQDLKDTKALIETLKSKKRKQSV